MRLKSIKLAGFKSFVDPTTVNLPSNMCAVVGPNGCGKSNVIDAVRWVMGESSAKNLRGESMTDVIFNGSGNRQPVGQASIELVFDNSDGGIGGEYASYSEISTRRQVTRDGQSEYFLNGTRCRRRDITDIFLGTGLGPRSYAIIEQGMISRLIESKPEELRVFIEEAAGISKYKERRRETESRMRRTLENLERLTDLRDELARQLQHLQRQAQAAEKYKALKAEERELRQRIYAAQWRDLQSRSEAAATALGELENRLEAVRTELQSLDTTLEMQRVTHTERSDEVGTAQGRFYAIGAEVSRIEQEIRHQGERAQQIESELDATNTGLSRARQHVEEDSERLSGWERELAELAPLRESRAAANSEAQAALTEADTLMQSWQAAWDSFNQTAARPQQQAEVQQSRIQHLEQSLSRLQKRLGDLDRERQSQGEEEILEALNRMREELSLAERDSEQAATAVSDTEKRLSELRDTRRQHLDALNDIRSRLQVQRGRQASLEALQQAARERIDGDAVGRWLGDHGLQQRPRLLQELQVAPEWQQAVETVLGSALQGVCVDSWQGLETALADLSDGEVMLIEAAAGIACAPDSLALKVEGSDRARVLLAGVHCAEHAADARALAATLPAGESVITADGLWIGSHWIRSGSAASEEGSLINRQQELDALSGSLGELVDEEAMAAATLSDRETRLTESEQELRTLRTRAQEAAARRAECAGKLRAEQARQEQLLNRRARMEQEGEDLRLQFEQEQEAVGDARRELAAAIEAMDQDSTERERRLRERDQLRGELDRAREHAQRCRDEAHQDALRHQSLLTQSETIRSALERGREQLRVLGERLETLQASRRDNDSPLSGLQQTLEEQLALRLEAEGGLSTARAALSEAEHALRQTEQQRLQVEQRVSAAREAMESKRLALHGLEHDLSGVGRQLADTGGDLEALVANLPDMIDLTEWQTELEKIGNRITRLGAINLAAVDEYQQQSERKQYLDAQNEDLESALGTLESAIRKIDRETRARFKETFDQVNSGLQELFPRVFGGGSANLEMTGEDLLDTGVSILARPPGKKNSTIHLLSGGEKALTAIALVFSIFQLNPAPFCMLDEVDAPLDDANVGRYARMVKEMSEKVQFVFITHNKITMEMAEHLMGVTMHEPGVSRLVSVDVEEAAELAAS